MGHPERPDGPWREGSAGHAGASPILDEVATSSYHADVRAVGVKVLKNKLSEYVRLAESGETVLVTDRDRVVAELGPPRPGRAPVLSDALLAEAVREGWITAPLVVAEGPPPRQPVATWDELARELAADRGER
jgi:antitoxin (DNA-binding transcriptional repressor) of toxin-antitoxin stability system